MEKNEKIETKFFIVKKKKFDCDFVGWDPGSIQWG